MNIKSNWVKEYPILSFLTGVFYLIFLVMTWSSLPEGNLPSFLLGLLLIFLAVVSIHTINNFISLVHNFNKNKDKEVSRIIESFYNELIDEIIPSIEKGEDRHKLNKVTQRMKRFINKDDL